MKYSVIVVAGLAVAGTAGLIAEDDLDKQLLESLEGRPPADSPERIVPRLIEGTQKTAERIEQGRVDEETVDLQEQILRDIDALLQQASPPDRPPQRQQSSASPSQQQQSQDSQSQNQQGQSPQESESEQDGQNDPNASSRESAERTAGAERAESDIERRLGLSTAAWGHLPPKVREQMRSAFSEEYLPEYDDLVRRYYEVLARRRAGDREPDARRDSGNRIGF